MSLPVIHLLPHEERRLLAGHLWVFGNEIDTQKSPPGRFASGDPVILADARGRRLGVGYINPHSLITVRLLSRDPDTVIDTRFFRGRLEQAIATRRPFGIERFGRLVFGESDRLPGLVVDRYGDYLVVQVTTAGMERWRDEIRDVLVDCCAPVGILFRNDSEPRKLEGLPGEVEVGWGTVPESVTVEEGGRVFSVSPWRGQKTGWYYDQREHRLRIAREAPRGRVLDAFSYVGGFGISALAGGSREAVLIDQSEEALERARANAAANGLPVPRTLPGEAFELLRALGEAGERFELVIVDPPAFIRRRKDQREGLLAYERLVTRAARLVADGGWLVFASCSSHLEPHDFRVVFARGVRRAGREVRIVAVGGQSPDHPIHPWIPETAYLQVLYGVIEEK
jgi:23S rRNA (cytosine1962-C5)-methyltransferase